MFKSISLTLFIIYLTDISCFPSSFTLSEISHASSTNIQVNSVKSLHEEPKKAFLPFEIKSEIIRATNDASTIYSWMISNQGTARMVISDKSFYIFMPEILQLAFSPENGNILIVKLLLSYPYLVNWNSFNEDTESQKFALDLETFLESLTARLPIASQKHFLLDNYVITNFRNILNSNPQSIIDIFTQMSSKGLNQLSTYILRDESMHSSLDDILRNTKLFYPFSLACIDKYISVIKLFIKLPLAIRNLNSNEIFTGLSYILDYDIMSDATESDVSKSHNVVFEFLLENDYLISDANVVELFNFLEIAISDGNLDFVQKTFQKTSILDTIQQNDLSIMFYDASSLEDVEMIKYLIDTPEFLLKVNPKYINLAYIYGTPQLKALFKSNANIRRIMYPLKERLKHVYKNIKNRFSDKI